MQQYIAKRQLVYFCQISSIGKDNHYLATTPRKRAFDVQLRYLFIGVGLWYAT